MRKLRGRGAIPAFSPSSSIDILRQVSDVIRSVYSDISQIITEWNAEIYPVLGTLPQGRSETRWNFTDDSISPKVNNLDGANLLVDTNSSSTTNGGRYWDLSRNRPKTVKEVFTAIYTELNNQIDALRTEMSLIGSGGISSTQQGRIGINIFDATQSSSASSLDGLTSSNLSNLRQLARDIYDSVTWSLDGDGQPNLTNFNVKDMVDALLILHEGAWDSSITIKHEWAETGGEVYLTTDTDDVIIGPVVNPTVKFFADGDTVIGGPSMFGTEVLRVVGDGRVEGEVQIKDHADYPDSESKIITAAIQTIGAAPTDILNVSIPIDTVATCRVLVQGREINNALYGGFIRTCMIYRAGAAPSLGAGGVQTTFTDTTVPPLAATMSADAVSNTLDITVTGVAGLTVNWTATLEIQMVRSNL